MWSSEIRYIRQLRDSAEQNLATEPRKFIVPKINFQANSIHQLIDITKGDVTEPPLTMELTEYELTNAISQPIEFPPYPCHNQAVEHYVQEVSKASLNRSGHQRRQQYILNKIQSIDELKEFNIKKDYISILSTN